MITLSNVLKSIVILLQISKKLIIIIIIIIIIINVTITICGGRPTVRPMGYNYALTK